ncbi:PASTA domain-containing protein [Streptomyces sp. NPDC046332]|uniref:PASTA domain-containing protein n=1 Tax=Streptomyces sp. NPDC046332 TaxID=3155133 RepID=UPI0033DBD326
MKVARHSLVLGTALTAVALGACSPESSSPSSTARTTAPAPAPTAAVTTPTPTPTPTATAEPTEPPINESADVPDVVGMNHREAQNLLRSQGFLVNEEDAQGDRFIINNSKWKVCRQDPEPGTTDTLRVAIYSVKLDESC